jgi:hypothetical protein
MDSQGPGNLSGGFSLMMDRRATDKANGVANSSRTGRVGSANSTPQFEGRATAGSMSNGFVQAQRIIANSTATITSPTFTSDGHFSTNTFRM